MNVLKLLETVKSSSNEQVTKTTSSATDHLSYPLSLRLTHFTMLSSFVFLFFLLASILISERSNASDKSRPYSYLNR